MRSVPILGALLAAVGLFVLIQGMSYTREESVLKFGGLEAKVKQERHVPGWVGGLALGAGIGLVGVGTKKR